MSRSRTVGIILSNIMHCIWIYAVAPLATLLIVVFIRLLFSWGSEDANIGILVENIELLSASICVTVTVLVESSHYKRAFENQEPEGWVDVWRKLSFFTSILVFIMFSFITYHYLDGKSITSLVIRALSITLGFSNMLFCWCFTFCAIRAGKRTVCEKKSC